MNATPTSADLILTGGTVITVDPAHPTAEAVAVADGRILAVGTREEVLVHRTGATEVRDLKGRAVLPGFVEAHGHPTLDMLYLGPRVTDIRPSRCATADEVLACVRQAVAAARPGAPLCFFGYSPLLQTGMPPLNRSFLDELAPANPLSVVEDNLHKAYGNSAALDHAGITKDTPAPVASSFEKDEDGELTGVMMETPALLQLTRHELEISEDEAPAALAAEYERYAAAGVTTTSDHAFNPAHRALLQTAVDEGRAKIRIRAYEMSSPARTSDVTPSNGSDLFKQIGIKLWADGSPWIGNIATSFSYEDTSATRSLGLPPGHRGCCNYTKEQVQEICEAYFPLGWQMSCHVHGDLAVDMVLDVYEKLLADHPREDHRLRLEHCGTMTPAQFARAQRLGVTCSLFVTHIYYWGDVLLDDLFGERGQMWTPAGAAVATGMRISLHNDSPVTPETPLLNIQTAVTRKARGSGRVLAAEQCLTLDEAIRAETIDAAWQIFCEGEVGSIEPGKQADLVVLSDSPYDVAPDEIGDIEVITTYLAGRPTHGCVD